MKIRSLVLIVSLTFISVAFAANKTKAAKQPVSKVWTQEPDSFLGIAFSSPIIGDVPACPMNTRGHSVDFSRVFSENKICVEESRSTDYFYLWGVPNLGFDYSVTTKTYDGKVGYFYLETSSDNFPLMAKLFITKYGEPTNVKTFVVTTKGGGEFENKVLLWEGKKVSIRLRKYSGNINTSNASITDIEYEAGQAKALDDGNTSGASKL